MAFPEGGADVSAAGDNEVTRAATAILRGVGAFETAGGVVGLLFLFLSAPGLNLLTATFFCLCAALIYCGIRLLRGDRRRLWLAAALLVPGLFAIQYGGLQFECALPAGLYVGGRIGESGLVRFGFSWTLASFVISGEEPVAVTSVQLNVMPLTALILLWWARTRDRTGSA